MEKTTKQSTSINKIEVGDYIKYGDKLTLKTYTTNTSETGCAGTQTFETDTDMLWRVMSKKENGEIEIVAVSNILGSKLVEDEDTETTEVSETNELEEDKTEGLYLNGETGFINAEKVLEDLCDRLYTSLYGEARSINVDDINSLTEFDPEENNWGDKGEKKHYLNNKSQTYTTGKFWDKEMNIFKTASTEDPVTVENNYYWYTVENTILLYDTLIQETATYSGDYTENNYPLFYWLSSRSTYVDNSSAGFYIRTVDKGDVKNIFLVDSDTGVIFYENEQACGVRPVVTLKSNIEIEKTTKTEGTKTWIIK